MSEATDNYDKLKTLVITFCVAALALFGIKVVIDISTPTAPAVSAVGMSKPTSSTPAPTQLVLGLARNEVTGRFLKTNGCQAFTSSAPAGVALTVYSAPLVKTLMPSYKGAPVGDQYDPLVQLFPQPKPVNGAVLPPPPSCVEGWLWVDFAVAKAVPPGKYDFKVFDVPVSLTVFNLTMPDRPTLPIYAELQFAQVSRAHNLVDSGDTLAKRANLNAAYRAAYRAHRVEPIKQAMNLTPSDLDQYSAYGASWRQTVLDGAIAPVCLLGPDKKVAPTQALLTRLYAAAPDGFVYAWDEGQGTEDQAALDRVKLIKGFIPQMKVFITREWSDAFAPYVDYFGPVLNWYNQAGHVAAGAYLKPIWPYTSCMANGNCTSKTDPATVAARTPVPMMVLDADTIEARVFPLLSGALGAKAVLYFNGTQRLPTAWADGGQYNEGGNGDGTFVYPAVAGENVSPSLRLKGLRQSSYDYEYFKLKPEAFAGLLTSATSWTKDHAALEAARRAVGGAL